MIVGALVKRMDIIELGLLVAAVSLAAATVVLGIRRWARDRPVREGTWKRPS